MSEQQKILIEVQKKIRVNTANLKAATVNLTMCEVNIKTYQKHLIKLDELHKVKINNVQLQVDRYVKNLKDMHKVLDDLLAEKDDLHKQLTVATHYGKVQCEFCLNYFTQAAITRHKNACATKPANEIVEKHKAEITEITENIAERKAALQKELAELNKAAKKKPVKVVKAPEPKQTLKEVIDEFDAEVEE